MALSTLAGSRAAANLPNVNRYNTGQQGANTNNVEQNTPPPSSKEYNKPQQAEPITSTEPDTILQYPQDESYVAYLLFRVKKINPWDIDVQSAVKLLDTPALSKEKDKYKEVLTQARGAAEGGVGDDEIDGVQTAEDRFRASLAEEEDDYSSAQSNIPTVTERSTQRDAQNDASRKNTLGIRSQYVDDLPAIKLYMPQAINFNDQVQYSNANLGASGAAALAGVNAGGSIAAGARAFFSDALGFLGDAFGEASSDPGLRRLALNRAAQSLPTGSQINTAASLGFQVTVNPNTRVLFENVVIRDFAFQFDFYPVSYAEAQVVQKIIRFFRTELYPSTIGSEQGVPIGFNFPHVFDIRLRVGGKNAPMPQPELCYLRGVQSTYNPGSMSFFDDGSPTHTAMTLNFTEFRTLSKQDIKEGR